MDLLTIAMARAGKSGGDSSGGGSSSFDLSDRMAKGVNNNGNVVVGAIIEGLIEDYEDEYVSLLANKASGEYSHAEGVSTTASGTYSHAEGYMVTVSGSNSHAEGMHTTASGYISHAEGGGTTASGMDSHAEGNGTIANHKSQHVFGEFNIADPSNAESYNRGSYIEIVGKGTADNARSNARTLDWNGNEVLAGKLTVGTAPTNNMDVATKQYVDQHAGSSFDLSDRIAKGVDDQGNEVEGAVVEGLTEDMTYMGVEFSANVASGMLSHAEGVQTVASGMISHSEGLMTTASGNMSHAEGDTTVASGAVSHAEGANTIASGACSHVEGNGTTASGDYSHSEGEDTIANHRSQHVFGECNIEDPSNAESDERGNYVEIVGNGVFNNRSNARTLDWNGNEVLAGSLTLGANTVDETVINPHTIKSISESITIVEFANSDWNVGSVNFTSGRLSPADTGTRAWMVDLLDPNTQSINFDSNSYRILFFVYNKSGAFQQRTEWLTGMPTFDFDTYDYRLVVRKQPDSGNITTTEAIAGVEIIVKSYNGEVSDITTSLLKSRKTGTSLEIADAAGGKVLSCVGSSPVTVSGYNLCKFRNIYGVGSVDCPLGITLPAGTYTLTARCTTTNPNVEQVKVFLGSFQGVMSVSGERVSRTYTLTRDIDAMIGLYADNQTSTLTDYEVTLSDIVLSEGVNAKPYEPYFDSITYTANELSNVKLTEYTNIVTSSSEFTISYINKNNVFAKSLASSLKIDGNNFVQPEDFGAAGDGYQDDATAINSCISYAIANGLVIRGYNSYRTSSPIQIIGDNVDLFINRINYVGSGNAVVYQGMNSMIQIDYIQSKGTGFRVQAATANVYYNTFTFNDIDAALDGFVVYTSYNAYQNKLNFSRIRGGTSYSCILFERDPNTSTGYLSEWQINGGLLTRSLWGVKGELNVAILLNVQTENLGSENNGGAIYSTSGAMPSIVYARTGEIILHNTLLKMSGTFKKTINPITNPTGVTLQAIDITELTPDTASEMKSDNARIVTNFMVQKEAMSSVRLTDHLVIWGNRFQFPQTVARSLNVTEDLDMRNQYYNDIIPQRFVSDNVTATIRLHPTYAANCLQSFIVEQKNGGELDIYDYVGNLIFDGSQQGNGKFKVSVYLNGDAALQYDMSNQIWDIEEIAIPVGGVSF